MAIRKEILDELLKDYKSPEDLLGPGGLLKQLTEPPPTRSTKWKRVVCGRFYPRQFMPRTNGR